MSTKDERILSPNGGRYPFGQVSDQYFDHLTARIMERIDAEEQGKDPTRLHSESATPTREAKVVDMGRKRRNRWLTITSIAASLILVATVALKFIPTSTSVAPTETLAAEYTEDDYNEELMSYAMADNMAVYDYLSGNGEE